MEKELKREDYSLAMEHSHPSCCIAGGRAKNLLSQFR